MIHNNISSLKYYLCTEVEQLICNFLESSSVNSKKGHYPILNDEVFANIDEPILKTQSEVRIEAHRRYCDIHIVLSGEENIDIFETHSLSP